MSDTQFTQDWWKRCVADEAKLTRWLQKLQQTEIGGALDHIDFLTYFNPGERETKILENIAEDEGRHSAILVSMFEDRKIVIDEWIPESVYWTDMLDKVGNTTYEHFEDYCAANYFGEALAATRFEIIEEMSVTPYDIKEFIRQALPDEIFHRETLRRISGERALEAARAKHDIAYAKLTGR